jgi:hypothetical protein
MRLFGITTRLPSFGEFTGARVLAVGLWLLACGGMIRMGQPPDRFSAGALLLIVEWACVGARMGIRPDLGIRHMIANLSVSALLVTAYIPVYGALSQ